MIEAREIHYHTRFASGKSDTVFHRIQKTGYVPTIALARRAAWTNGCPNGETRIAKEGPDAVIRADVRSNFIYRYVLTTTRTMKNQSLAWDLQNRTEDAPNNKQYPLRSVPPSFLETQRYKGFATQAVFDAVMGFWKGMDLITMYTKYDAGKTQLQLLRFMDESIAASSNVDDLKGHFEEKLDRYQPYRWARMYRLTGELNAIDPSTMTVIQAKEFQSLLPELFSGASNLKDTPTYVQRVWALRFELNNA